MKLSQKSQGFRFTRAWWEKGRYVDVRVVGKPDTNEARRCVGIDQDGKEVTWYTDEHDEGWINLGGTTKFKGKKV